MLNNKIRYIPQFFKLELKLIITIEEFINLNLEIMSEIKSVLLFLL